jgi:hypothetical protein
MKFADGCLFINKDDIDRFLMRQPDNACINPSRFNRMVWCKILHASRFKVNCIKARL